MKAGRELDALMAEKVMGCTVEHRPNMIICGCQSREHNDPDAEGAYLSGYSTDIAAAWEVVNKVLEAASECQYSIARNGTHYFQFIGAEHNSNGSHPIFEGKGESAPHAICLAALKAVGKS